MFILKRVSTRKKNEKEILINIWIILNKYLLNINIYLFDTKNINLTTIFFIE